MIPSILINSKAGEGISELPFMRQVALLPKPTIEVGQQYFYPFSEPKEKFALLI